LLLFKNFLWTKGALKRLKKSYRESLYFGKTESVGGLPWEFCIFPKPAEDLKGATAKGSLKHSPPGRNWPNGRVTGYPGTSANLWLTVGEGAENAKTSWDWKKVKQRTKRSWTYLGTAWECRTGRHAKYWGGGDRCVLTRGDVTKASVYYRVHKEVVTSPRAPNQTSLSKGGA